MRADRLVSLVLLLRQRGRLSAATLAKELEVCTRTVLRDIEALSAAGVPVYAERGRHGGVALLPGFRTELTGLNHDEALALLVTGTHRGAQTFGLGSALASAMRKVVDALPEGHRTIAAETAGRLLLDPKADLLARPLSPDAVGDGIVSVVRQAVSTGNKLRINYAPEGKEPGWRTVDPIGLVTVVARVHPSRRDDLTRTALTCNEVATDHDGWVRLELTWQDARHAEWALWQFAMSVEAVEPQWLRMALRDKAAEIVGRYEPSP